MAGAFPSPRHRPIRVASFAAAAAIALVAVAWRVLTFSGFNNDHYIYIAGGQQMLLGEWPVRDFVDPGWPLMYVMSAIPRALFGRALGVELLMVASAFAIGAAFTLLAAWRLSASFAIALAVSLIEIAINPRSFGYPKIALYAAAAWTFVAVTRSLTVWRVLLLAVLTAVAFLFRHDHGLYIGVGALAAVVLGVWDGAPRSLVFRASVFLAGVVVLLLPWAAFVQYHVGLMAYLRPALEFSRAEAEGTLLRSLPRLVTSGRAVAELNAAVLLFYLFHALPFVCIPLAVWRARRGNEQWAGESAAVCAIGVTAFAMNVGFIRTPLAARLPDAVVCAAILGAWLIGLAWRTHPSTLRYATAAASMLALATTMWAVTLMADVRNGLNTAGILNRSGALVERIHDLRVRLRKPMPERSHIPSRNAEALMPFFAFVERCTQPTDRLVMTGLSPDIFVLANRGFAGGQMAFRPAFYTSAPDQRRALARLRAQSIPFVVVALEEEAGFRHEMPLIASWVDNRYQKVARIPVPDTRGLQLYVERDRQLYGVDSATGWPCFVH